MKLCRSAQTALFVSGLFIALAATTLAGAQDQILYNFGSVSSDVTLPYGNLVFDQSGNLYGVAAGGGSGAGGIFELSPTSSGSWTEQIIYKASKTTDGLGLNGALTIDASGNLYATTFSGGSSTCGCGQVFELSPTSSGWTKTVLFEFANGYNGGFPASGVILDAAGNLYGTTTSGGISNLGVVFELFQSSKGWRVRILYAFSTALQGDAPRGGLLLDSAGRLYGTTTQGGNGTCENGCGTVYQLTPPTTGTAWAYRRIFSFNGTDGILPSTDSLVMDAAGNLYGTTVDGGSLSNGIVYELSPLSSGVWRETVLHAFTGGTDGGSPEAGLTFDASGNLWGITTYSLDAKGDGTVFELTPGTGGQWDFSTVYSFLGYPNDGQNPLGRVIFDSAGNLYGTTQKGGTQKKGVVYELPGPLAQRN